MDFFSLYYAMVDSGSISSPLSDSGSVAGRSDNYSDGDVMSEEESGRKKFFETRNPVYRGVRRKNSGKWVCEVREPNKKSRIWLGTFLTAEMAARAHDVAGIALRGRSACLNFADSAWRLPIPASSDPKDIQKAAREAAEAFRPTEQCIDNAQRDEKKDGEQMIVTMCENKGLYLYEDEVFGTQFFCKHGSRVDDVTSSLWE